MGCPLERRPKSGNRFLDKPARKNKDLEQRGDSENRSDALDIAVIIPALDEEAAIAKVLAAIPAWVSDVIVVDNGSTDRTAFVARSGGARIVREARRGYGAACRAGIAALSDPDIVVFLDADYSDRPEEMERLILPIAHSQADFVIGSRTLRPTAPGALSLPQRLGNRVACWLMRLFWRADYSDLGPFRAIRFDALQALDMRDRDFGWTVEMQIKAIRRGLTTIEVPVSYHPRIGQSKISGTLTGCLRAGYRITAVILTLAILP